MSAERPINIDLSTLRVAPEQTKPVSLKQGAEPKPLQPHQAEATNRLIPGSDLTHYWDVTKECLETFHGMKPEEVNKTFTDYKARIAQLPADRRDEVMALTYHTEAFYLANELAKNEIPLREHKDEYFKMWEKHREPPHNE